MTVIIKYVVERNGEEKMTFTSKADADAYDKMLEMADELFTLLGSCELMSDETQREEMSLYLAQNREDVLQALGAKRPTKPKKEKTTTKATTDTTTTDTTTDTTTTDETTTTTEETTFDEFDEITTTTEETTTQETASTTTETETEKEAEMI